MTYRTLLILPLERVYKYRTEVQMVTKPFLAHHFWHITRHGLSLDYNKPNHGFLAKNVFLA